MPNLALLCTRRPGAEALRRPGAAVGFAMTSALGDRGTELRVTSEKMDAGALLLHCGPEGVEPLWLDPAAAAVGHLHDPAHGWKVVGDPAPEGTFALARANPESIELLTDAMGTRSFWYVLTGEQFVASTSQRALAVALRSFEPRDEATLFLLVNGILPPSGGWDRRVHRVPAGGRVVLNRARWQIRVESPDYSFDSDDTLETEHAAALLCDRLTDAVGGLDLDFERWVLPLSGGYDSRLLARLLADREGLEAVTWGPPDWLTHEGGDAVTASRLAEALGICHRTIATELPQGDVIAAMETFVRAGEGATTQFAGYMDGMKLWKDLASEGVSGIIRGDEAFGGSGWSPVQTEQDVRTGLSLATVGDYPGLAWLKALDGSQPDAFVAGGLSRGPEEDPESWRHRLYHTVRVPLALAPLTQVKSHFVDTVNPLQFGRIAELVRRLPNHLRRDKLLLRRVVDRITPSVPYGCDREADHLLAALQHPETVSVLREELDSVEGRGLYPPAVVRRLVEGLRTSGTKHGPMRLALRSRLNSWVRSSLPQQAKRRLRRFAHPSGPGPNVLAFRAWVALRAQRQMREVAGGKS